MKVAKKTTFETFKEKITFAWSIWRKEQTS
jgi:hypothetical protein